VSHSLSQQDNGQWNNFDDMLSHFDNNSADVMKTDR